MRGFHSFLIAAVEPNCQKLSVKVKYCVLSIGGLEKKRCNLLKGSMFIDLLFSWSLYMWDLLVIPVVLPIAPIPIISSSQFPVLCWFKTKVTKARDELKSFHKIRESFLFQMVVCHVNDCSTGCLRYSNEDCKFFFRVSSYIPPTKFCISL